MHQEAYPLRPAPFLSRRSIATAVVALVVGAGAAVGIYTLVDDDAQPASRVIVTTPVTPGEGTAAKNEAGMAAAIAGGYGYDADGQYGADGQRYGTSQYRVNPSTGQASPYPGLSDEAQQAEGTAAKNEAVTAAAVGSGHQHGE
jgi:hypothetical protein